MGLYNSIWVARALFTRSREYLLYSLALIPAYIEHCVRLSIGHDLVRGASPSDEFGYIYGFEAFGGYSHHLVAVNSYIIHLDITRPGLVRLKVGRTNDIVRRYGEHQRRCPLLRLTLVGYYPSNGESVQDLATGRLNPSMRTASSHLLERVVHRELGNVAIHAPYLSTNGVTGGLFLGSAQVRTPCASCRCRRFLFTFLLMVI